MSAPTPYAISLVLHQDQTPGWRVHLNPDGVEGGHPVSIKQAEDLARAATDIIDTVTQDDAVTTPYMVVRNGTTALRSTLEGELKDAEEKAANIAALRRTLGEMT
jgi:siroheme synthase